MKFRPAALGGRLRRERSAVFLDDGAADGEAQAEALAVRLRREERLEDALAERRRDAAAVVADGEADARVSLAFQRNGNFARLAVERLHGVQEKI